MIGASSSKSVLLTTSTINNFCLSVYTPLLRLYFFYGFLSLPICTVLTPFLSLYSLFMVPVCFFFFVCLYSTLVAFFFTVSCLFPYVFHFFLFTQYPPPFYLCIPYSLFPTFPCVFFFFVCLYSTLVFFFTVSCLFPYIFLFFIYIVPTPLSLYSLFMVSHLPVCFFSVSPSPSFFCCFTQPVVSLVSYL